MVAQSEILKHILAEIESEHLTLIQLLSGLSVDQALSRPPSDEWSAVDVLIHITAWQDNALQIARLQAMPNAPVLNPRSSPAGILRINVQQFNKEVSLSHRDWTLEQAIAWHNQINNDLRSALANLPCGQVLSGIGKSGACMWYWRPAVIHSREHRHALERRLLTQR
jgi:hypothetical protein